MEQDTFVDLEEFNENEINLDEPPRSAIHYLQQVAVSRKRCAQVVKASIDPKILSNNKPSSSSLSEFENNKQLPTSISAPPREWSYAKCDEFSWNRTLLQAKRDKYKKPPDIIYPNAGDYEGWRKFCLGNAKNSGAGFEQQIGASSASDEQQPFRCGHPPTPAIVLNLSENRANCLVEHLVQIFLDKGYSKSLFQWFYAVLLVVEKPLLHDVCAALRAFVKRCRFLRSTIPTTTTDATASPLADNNAPSAYEFSLFIALISIYFEQKDLADHQ